MFSGIAEIFYISKVETIVDTELRLLPNLFKLQVPDLAHVIIINQYRAMPDVFAKHKGKRLMPEAVALHSTLTFMKNYSSENSLVMQGEDCLGALKIVCLKLAQRAASLPTTQMEAAFMQEEILPVFLSFLQKDEL